MKTGKPLLGMSAPMSAIVCRTSRFTFAIRGRVARFIALGVQQQAVLEVNLKSAFFGTRLVAQPMIKQGGGGQIINITSIHEDWPMPGNTAYRLSKGAMRMLTRTAAAELAPRNILVVGVAPGAVATPINLFTMTDPALMAN